MNPKVKEKSLSKAVRGWELEKSPFGKHNNN